MVPEIVEGIKIIHDDDSIVVIDKPVGVAVHPSPGWSGPTVVGHLAGAGFRISTSGASERKGIVQRLDVGTSGVMVICKSEHAYSVLKNAFRNRTVDKTYHALVQGHPDPLEGTIDAPDRPAPAADYKFAVMPDGKHSVTHYQVLEAHRFASLLEVHLETGRTHQIRVHMAALKHPCVGDITYGADPVLPRRVGLERQWLHAVRLGLRAPGLAATTSSTSRRTPTTWPRRWRPSAMSADARRRPGPRGPHEDLPAVADLFVACPRRRRARDAADRRPGREVPGRVCRLGPRARELWVAETATDGPSGSPTWRGTGSTACTSPPTRPAAASAPRCSTWSRRHRPDGFCLWVFESNTPAREFYPRRGLLDLERTDGSANMERAAGRQDGLAGLRTRWRSTAA